MNSRRLNEDEAKRYYELYNQAIEFMRQHPINDSANVIGKSLNEEAIDKLVNLSVDTKIHQFMESMHLLLIQLGEETWDSEIPDDSEKTLIELKRCLILPMITTIDYLLLPSPNPLPSNVANYYPELTKVIIARLPDQTPFSELINRLNKEKKCRVIPPHHSSEQKDGAIVGLHTILWLAYSNLNDHQKQCKKLRDSMDCWRDKLPKSEETINLHLRVVLRDKIKEMIDKLEYNYRPSNRSHIIINETILNAFITLLTTPHPTQRMNGISPLTQRLHQQRLEHKIISDFIHLAELLIADNTPYASSIKLTDKKLFRLFKKYEALTHAHYRYSTGILILTAAVVIASFVAIAVLALSGFPLVMALVGTGVVAGVGIASYTGSLFHAGHRKRVCAEYQADTCALKKAGEAVYTSMSPTLALK